MKYISFDVGIKNLSYCIIDINNESFDVVDWNVITLCDTKDKVNQVNLINVGKTLKNKLDILLKDFSIDIVLIENQIGPLAIKMKALQGMIAQYFIMKNIENIEFISSINKLKPYLGNLKTNYNQRKKYGIEICKCYLNQFECLIKWQSYFNQNKKKDDLADCFLQALSYFFKKNILQNKIIITAVDLKV
tara:strand:+ start:39 stop:608 length:570 start_codon:yes stop_codon:yes gene_type:complete